MSHRCPFCGYECDCGVDECEHECHESDDAGYSLPEEFEDDDNEHDFTEEELVMRAIAIALYLAGMAEAFVHLETCEARYESKGNRPLTRGQWVVAMWFWPVYAIATLITTRIDQYRLGLLFRRDSRRERR
jgi:hypothetical protein